MITIATPIMMYAAPPQLMQARMYARRPQGSGVRRIGIPPLPTGQALARILVSDDDVAISRLYSMLLPEYGFEVISAPGGDGAQTLDLARRAKPHLLITDLNKPSLSGAQVRAALRAERRTARLPILLASAIDQIGAQGRPERTAFDDYLLKPLTIDDLIHRIAALLPLSPSEHDLLAARALAAPDHSGYHPITGLACLHPVAEQIPAVTAQPGWAACVIGIQHYAALVQAQGRYVAEGVLTRLANIARAQAGRLCVGHTGFDPQITLVGPAEQVAAAARQIEAAFAALRHPQPISLRLIQTDSRHGAQLSLPALRALLSSPATRI